MYKVNLKIFCAFQHNKNGRNERLSDANLRKNEKRLFYMDSILILH